MTAVAAGGPAAGKTPGQPTDSELVELYQLVYLADHALSVEEIADEMPSAFRNAAYLAHRSYLEGEGAAGMADDPKAKTIAWRRWIEHVVGDAVQHRHLLAYTTDGRPWRGRRRDGAVYHANTNRPPHILRRRDTDFVEAWTPEYATLGARHAARAERRRLALRELDKARKNLDAAPGKTAADKRKPATVTVEELTTLIEACETQIRFADQ